MKYKDFLKQSLIEHFYVEYVIDESNLITEDFRKLLIESGHLVDGIDELAAEVANNCKRNQYLTKIDHNKYKEFSFANYVYVQMFESMASIFCGTININPYGYVIYLKIGNQIPQNRVCGFIGHELNHAYQRYTLQSKQISLDQWADDYGYVRAGKKRNLGKEQIEKIVGNIYYVMNNIERGSFATQIFIEAKDKLSSEGKNLFDSIEEAVKTISETDTYKFFEETVNNARWLENEKDPENRRHALVYANYIKGIKNNTKKSMPNAHKKDHLHYRKYIDFARDLRHMRDKCMKILNKEIPNMFKKRGLIRMAPSV